MSKLHLPGDAYQNLNGSDSTDSVSSLSAEQEDNNRKNDDLRMDSSASAEEKLETLHHSAQSIPREIHKLKHDICSSIIINTTDILSESLHDPNLEGIFKRD